MKITKAKLKQIIKEEIGNLSHEDELGGTEPRFDTGMRSPEQKLIDALAARAHIDQMSPEELEALAGGDEEVMGLIRSIQDNQMYDDPERSASISMRGRRLPPGGVKLRGLKID